MAAVASAVLPDPVGPDERDRAAVALPAGGPAVQRVADAVFGGEELAAAGHPPEQHPPGGWDDVVDGEGSYVGGGGFAGLGVLPEAAAPAVAVERAATPRRAPTSAAATTSDDDGGARPVEPRCRQAAGVGGPRSGGWLSSGEAGGGAEPDVDPAVDPAAGERDGEARSGPRREAGGEHQPAGGDQGCLEAGAWFAGVGVGAAHARLLRDRREHRHRRAGEEVRGERHRLRTRGQRRDGGDESGQHRGGGCAGDAGGSVGGERAGEGGEANVAEAEAARLDQVHDQERGAHECRTRCGVGERRPRLVASRRDDGDDHGGDRSDEDERGGDAPLAQVDGDDTDGDTGEDGERRPRGLAGGGEQRCRRSRRPSR